MRDSAGILIAAFLLATVSEAATWKIEMVDQAGTGKFTSLKIDKHGNAHLAYVTEDGRDTLKYAFWDHALKQWFIMAVAERASFSSLALDSQQRPHISWVDTGTVAGCKLRYGHWDGTVWKQQAIPLAAETIAFYSSLALDTDDRPSISFYEYDGPRESNFRVRMRVVTWDGRYWQVSTADGDNQSGKFNSLAVDPRGRLHLAYANVNAGTAGTRYALRDGASWHLELVDGREQNNREYVGHAVCIALDKAGDPHLSYMNTSRATVKYAVRKSNAWTVQEVDRLAGVAYPDRNSIALDEEGRPYIGYYDAARGILKLAYQQGQSWVTEVIDGNHAGFTSSLQLDRGFVWISYSDGGNGGVKVARAEISEIRSSGKSGPNDTAPERH